MPIRTIPSLGPHASANVCFKWLACPEDAYFSIAVGSKMAQIPLHSTDGLLEHSDGGISFVPACLEQVVRDTKCESASDIVQAITRDMRTFATPTGDISVVVIKRLYRAGGPFLEGPPELASSKEVPSSAAPGRW